MWADADQPSAAEHISTIGIYCILRSNDTSKYDIFKRVSLD